VVIFAILERSECGENVTEMRKGNGVITGYLVKSAVEEGEGALSQIGVFGGESGVGWGCVAGLGRCFGIRCSGRSAGRRLSSWLLVSLVVGIVFSLLVVLGLLLTWSFSLFMKSFLSKIIIHGRFRRRKKGILILRLSWLKVVVKWIHALPIICIVHLEIAVDVLGPEEVIIELRSLAVKPVGSGEFDISLSEIIFVVLEESILISIGKRIAVIVFAVRIAVVVIEGIHGRILQRLANRLLGIEIYGQFVLAINLGGSSTAALLEIDVSAGNSIASPVILVNVKNFGVDGSDGQARGGGCDGCFQR